jgi:hypothetical protein
VCFCGTDLKRSISSDLANVARREEAGSRSVIRTEVAENKSWNRRVTIPQCSSSWMFLGEFERLQRSWWSFQALEINFGHKDCFNRRITIEIGTMYKNKNEFHRDW